jgi:hypothetical protein
VVTVRTLSLCGAHEPHAFFPATGIFHWGHFLPPFNRVEFLTRFQIGLY